MLFRSRYSDPGTCFPAGLQGFFYYYVPRSPAPRPAGELRFRKMHSPEPSAFTSGKDLEAAHGLPWRLQLPTIASFDQHQALRNILLRDGLVDEETMHIAEQMGRARARRKETVPLIHSFRQPFYLEFGSPLHWWHFMGPNRLYFSGPMANILSLKIGGERYPSPWIGLSALYRGVPRRVDFLFAIDTGSAICAFTKSIQPGHKHARVVNVTVLSIVDPVQRNPECPDSIFELAPRPPRAKGLLHRGSRVWALDLDDCEPRRGEGFHVLFENEELPPLRTGRLLGPPRASA